MLELTTQCAPVDILQGCCDLPGKIGVEWLEQANIQHGRGETDEADAIVQFRSTDRGADFEEQRHQCTRNRDGRTGLGRRVGLTGSAPCICGASPTELTDEGTERPRDQDPVP